MREVTVNVPEIIRFFDVVNDYSKTHSKSVIEVCSEDLAAACFKKYLEAKKPGTTVCIRWDDDPPKEEGGRKKLDRWIVVDRPDCGRQVFQTEIKHWSAHSSNGKCIQPKTSCQDLREHKHGRWKIQWNSKKKSLKYDGAVKVLMPMEPPPFDLNGSCILPLIIYWAPMLPKDKLDDPLFSVCTNSECSFKELWVFSVSSYLRSIVAKEPKISLEMPTAAKRLRILKDLFPC